MTAGQRVVVVEDDDDIRDLLVFVLEQAGLEVSTAATGAEAERVVADVRPDLITLDLTLPDADGTDVCRRLRAFSDAYIMMVTGRAEESDRLIGLEVGADDYLVKPFSTQEIRARAAALLRRPRVARQQSKEVVDAGAGLVLLPSSHTALLDGEAVPCTPTEVDLLVAFARRPGETLTRSELVRLVWQGEFIESDFLVDVHVGSLRRKLRRAGSRTERIVTVDGTSYLFAPDGAA